MASRPNRTFRVGRSMQPARRPRFSASGLGLLFLLAAGIVAAGEVKAAPPQLVYPLKKDAALTSNFGEYRINHFHSGIDLSTGGESGQPVMAVADGRVAIMRASPVGYGKVVYLEHADGLVSVYAHLSEFAETLDPIARQCQRAAGRFAFEKDFKGEGPRVKAGEVIGYAGSTGTAVAHLHLEVRREGLPLNPLSNGIPFPDHIPPRITRVGVVPLDAASHAGGLPEPKVFAAPAAGTPLRVSAGGRFGLMVEAEDAVDGGAFRLTPYGFRLTVDGKVLYQTRYERFDYAERSISELDFLYELKERRQGCFHRLYLHSQPTLFHDGVPAGDAVSWEEGPHQVLIEAFDAAGNVARLDVALEVVPPLPSLALYRVRGAEKAVNPVGGQVELQEFRLGVQTGGFSGAETIVAACARFPGSGRPPTACTAVPAREGVMLHCDVPEGFQGPALVYWQTASGQAWAATAPLQSAAAGGVLSSPDSAASISLGRDAVFRAFPTAVWKQAGPSGKGLAAASDLYVFEQPWEPLRRKVKVAIQPTGGAKTREKGLGVYLLDRGTFWFMDSGTSALVTHLGSYLLMRDTLPPRIGNCRAATARNRRILVIHADDEESGLADDSVRVTLDGRPVIGEPNPATASIYYYPSKPLKAGLHTVHVDLTDRAGNRAARTFKVRIP